MMKFTSRLFGEVEYTKDEVYTFPGGLLGFPEHRHYVLREQERTKPIVWLLSVEEGGPEVAMVDPQEVSERYVFRDIPLDRHMEERLQTAEKDRLETFAIVTLPDNIKQISMNLRTPVLINPETRRGMEYPAPGLPNEPVRCLIYRDLIASRPQDKPGNLVVHRKPGETIEIGDEISIRVEDFVNGGVRLVVTAPKSVTVSRGDGIVTPKQETIRASRQMDLARLEGLMRMHNVMLDPQGSLPPTMLQAVPQHTDADAPNLPRNVRGSAASA